MSRSTETRERIIKAAIRCFARDGLHGVSLRAVGKEAGQKNTAAVHYHFGDREGLLRASLDFILSAISEPVSLAEASAMGCVFPAHPSALQLLLYEEFLSILLLPMRCEGWGDAGVKLLSRVVLGEFASLAIHLEQSIVAESVRMGERLEAFVPGVPVEQLLVRLEYAMVTLVCGAASAKYDEILLGDEANSISHVVPLIDFVAAGLCAPFDS